MHCKKSAIIKYKGIKNPYIENEVKGFVQHLVLDLQYHAETIRQYVTAGLRTTASFLDEYHSYCYSITDFEYDSLYAEYIEFLSDRNLQMIAENIYAVRKDMEYKAYPSKTSYLISFAALFKYVYSILFPYQGTEYDKDIWDIRNLGIPYSTAVCRQRFTVNYTCIRQKWLRDAAKQYNYYRIQNRTMSAVLDDMKALRLFSEFLDLQYPNLSALDQLTRPIMEDYFAFLNDKGYVSTTYNRRISAIRTFLSIGNMLDIDGFPSKLLILNSDYRKIVHQLPKYFTDYELRQMNEHIADLPIQIGRMFFVLENCGMRVSDLCSTPIIINGKRCIEKNSEGEYIFTYSMPKTHRVNVIPVSEVVGLVIEEAIADSLDKYGDGCKYVFAGSETTPISSETFSIRMNIMSKKNNIVHDNGTPLRIKGHTFRGTVATQYANCGISMDVIRMMLGQDKIGVLKHYITIHGDTMLNYMKPLLDEDDQMIRNIGQASPVEPSDIPEPALIPLSNGRCSKNISTGLCEHANACYSCRMFIPSSEHISIYHKQLLEAQNNIKVAELHGYERILEINIKLRDDLERIIEMVTSDDCEQNCIIGSPTANN